MKCSILERKLLVEFIQENEFRCLFGVSRKSVQRGSGNMMREFAALQKKTDIFEVGNGVVLVNVLTENKDGKLEQIDTYIGAEGKKALRVKGAYGLDVTEIQFDYNRYMSGMLGYIETYMRICMNDSQ